MKLFKFLVMLREDYLTRSLNGEPDGVTKELFGDSIFRPTESKTVLNSERLRRQREFRINGETVLMVKHLTLGNTHDPRRTVQIHFDVCDGRLRLGRIGEHLGI